MKAKVMILIAVCGIVTLSFTFTSTKTTEQKAIPSTGEVVDAPAGGLGSEDKF